MSRDPEQRLGCGPLGIQEIFQHPFFSSIDIGRMRRREIPPPFKPTIVGSEKENSSREYIIMERSLDVKMTSFSVVLIIHLLEYLFLFFFFFLLLLFFFILCRHRK